VEKARQYVPPVQLKSGFMTHPDTGAITEKGDDKAIVQIYMAVLTDMWSEFISVSDGSYLEKMYKNKYDSLPEPKEESLEKFKFTYRGPVLKTTKATLSDENGGVNQNFKKLDADGNQDKGYYSSAKAWPKQARVTGSSVAVPFTQGPLFGTIPRSNNIHNGEPSGGGGVTYQMPPVPASATSCSEVSDAVKTEDILITALGKDMNGLNRDADCDDDAFVNTEMNTFYTACAEEEAKDAAYVCPEFESICHIAGEDDQLPTQLFTNNENARQKDTSAADAVLPSASVLLATMIFVFNQR
jgi:hypothetical protein